MVDARALHERQDALRNVGQHGVDVGGFLPHQFGRLFNFFDHDVKRHDGFANFVLALDFQTLRKVLADRNFGHFLFHVANGVNDLAVQHQAGTRQQRHGQHGDERQSQRGGAEVVVNSVDGLVFGAGFFNLKGVDVAAQLTQVLVHSGGQGGLGQIALSGAGKVGGVVHRREIIGQSFLRKRHQPLLGGRVGHGHLLFERLLQLPFAGGQGAVGVGYLGFFFGLHHVHHGNLHVLELAHQLHGLDGAGHHALCHGFHFRG